MFTEDVMAVDDLVHGSVHLCYQLGHYLVHRHPTTIVSTNKASLRLTLRNHIWDIECSLLELLLGPLFPGSLISYNLSNLPHRVVRIPMQEGVPRGQLPRTLLLVLLFDTRGETLSELARALVPALLDGRDLRVLVPHLGQVLLLPC